MTNKYRLSASVDESLIAAAEAAIGRGRAPNLSAWVNDALRLKLEHDQRLTALSELLSAYESKHGVITAEEVVAATRWASARAVVVRGSLPASRKRKRSA
jgi:Arc/MetJ-type ribon-helix-helix transcriptional regulator